MEPTPEKPLESAANQDAQVVYGLEVKSDQAALAAPFAPRRNGRTFSLGTLFTLTTLAAIAVAIVVHYPALLCLLVPFTPAAVARMVYLKQHAEKMGEQPTLTDLSLNFGTSLVVAMVVLTSLLTAFTQIFIPLQYIGGLDALPLSLTVAVAGSAFHLYFILSKIWLFPGGSELRDWKSRGLRFVRGLIELTYTHGLALWGTWPCGWEVKGSSATVGTYCLTCAAIGIAGVAGYLFAKHLPQAALITLVGFILGNIVGSYYLSIIPVAIVGIISLLLGLALEWKLAAAARIAATPPESS